MFGMPAHINCAQSRPNIVLALGARKIRVSKFWTALIDTEEL